MTECIRHCKADQFSVIWPNTTFKRCLDCERCHRGFGLYPNCGEQLTFPPNIIECKPCENEKTFSADYDTGGCKYCHSCAEHEIVTKKCSRNSDTMCSGTCSQGYFFDKTTHNCKKCFYCCHDGNDQKQKECIQQGLDITICARRPDKNCGPDPTTKSTTDQQRIGKPVLILSSVGFILLLGVGFLLFLIFWKRLRRRERRNAENCDLDDECVPARIEGSQSKFWFVYLTRCILSVAGVQENITSFSNFLSSCAIHKSEISRSSRTKLPSMLYIFDFTNIVI